jgi:hypothetical protein
MRIDYHICDEWADSFVDLSRAGKTELRYDVSKELQERYPDLAGNNTFRELFALWNG